MTDTQHPTTGQDAHDGGAERPAYAVGQVWMTRNGRYVIMRRINSAAGFFNVIFCDKFGRKEYHSSGLCGEFGRPHNDDLTTFIAHSISDLASIAQEGRPEDRERIAELEGALDPNAIAAIIRKVDGDHSLGAGALGEAISRAALSSGEA